MQLSSECSGQERTTTTEVTGVSIANCRAELALILLQTVSTMKRELETFL